jgi:hypothetical protein
MPLLDRLTPISVDEMLLEWALAERHEWRDPPAALVRKADAGEPLGTTEREAAIDLFARVTRRGPEVTFFRGQGAEWFRTDFPIAHLGDVVLHKHMAVCHWDLTPGSARPYPRTVADLARRSDVPSAFDGDGKPDPRGNRRPILVATTLDGSWHIAEGSHRMHTAWSTHERRDPGYQGTLRVIVGVHPRMHEWPSFFE